jgi:hypothetical protein
MSQYDELKRLAEAAQYESNDTQRGLIASTAAFFAACIPEQILALIAENERLHAMTETTMGVGSGEGSLFVHGDYDSIKAAQAIVIDRDELRAEVAGLRTGYQAYERVNAELKAEVEKLRGVMACVVNEVPHHENRNGNAPGHCHSIPGVWDQSNGAKSGTECGWCKVWNTAVAMSKGEQS